MFALPQFRVEGRVPVTVAHVNGVSALTWDQVKRCRLKHPLHVLSTTLCTRCVESIQILPQIHQDDYLSMCSQVAHPVFNLGAFKLSASSTITVSVDGSSGRKPVVVDAVWLTRGYVIDEDGPLATRVGTWASSTFHSGFVGSGCEWEW
jgi:hypothetical protein